MLKFLRTHNKKMIVVFGVFLLVSFLMIDTLPKLTQEFFSGTALKIDGKKYDRNDYQRATREIKAVETTLFRLDESISSMIGLDSLRDRLGLRKPDHWLLLCHEAEQAGFVGGPRDAENFLRSFADDLGSAYAQLMMRFDPSADYATFAAQSAASFERALQVNRSMAVASAGLSEAGVDAALAKVAGIFRLFRAYNSGAEFGNPLNSVVSTKEATLSAMDLLDTAVIDAVVYPAAAVANTMPEPTDEEVAAFFEQHRGKRPSESPLGIGYFQEKAVKVEWLAFDAAALGQALAVDRVAVRKLWMENKALYGEDFETARPSAEAAYKRDLTQRIVASTESVMQREISRSTAALAAEGRYKVLPDDWAAKRPSLLLLAERVQSELVKEFNLPVPMGTVAESDGAWKTAQNLVQLPGIGNTAFGSGGARRVLFPDMALSIKELGDPAQRGLQAGLIYGPLEMGNNRYYFRVLDARAEGPAPELAPIRAQVVADLKLSKAFDDVSARAAELKSQALAQGFTEFAAQAQAEYIIGAEVTRDRIRRPDMGVFPGAGDQAVRDAILAVSMAWDPRQDVLQIPLEQRTIAQPSAAARGVVIATIQRRMPLTIEEYRQNLGAAINRAARQSTLDPAEWPFDLEDLAQRHTLEIPGATKRPARGEGETEDESVDPAQPADSGA